MSPYRFLDDARKAWPGEVGCALATPLSPEYSLTRELSPSLWFPDVQNPSIGPAMLTDKDNLLRRLHALRSEHRDLDTVIARITEHGPTDQLQVQRLKKRKLGLKDEIAWLESRLIPDRTA
jgi:hypothetical protein